MHGRVGGGRGGDGGEQVVGDRRLVAGLPGRAAGAGAQEERRVGDVVEPAGPAVRGIAEVHVAEAVRGAPELPADVTGSISHKRTLAVALAAPRQNGISVGVDIEPVPAVSSLGESGWDNRPDISSRVMTPDELALLADIPERLRRREVILHFSLKEALYKAINPLIGRYVSFQEAVVLPAADGTVAVTLNLKKQEGPFRVGARWTEMDGHLLTTAQVESAE